MSYIKCIWCGLAVMAAVDIGASTVKASESAPPRNVQIEAETYRLITDDELKNALRGKTMIDLAKRAAMALTGWTESFSAEGNLYGRSGDRLPWMKGTFEIYSDHYCTAIGSTECYALVKSDRGDLATISLRDGIWVNPVRIEIHPTRSGRDPVP
jgi:hypothetical protein